MIKKPKITPKERDRIVLFLASKTSLRRIAKLLGRSISSISEEVRRNSVKGEYTSITAQRLSEKRNRASRRTNPLKKGKAHQIGIQTQIDYNAEVFGFTLEFTTML